MTVSRTKSACRVQTTQMSLSRNAVDRVRPRSIPQEYVVVGIMSEAQANAIRATAATRRDHHLHRADGGGAAGRRVREVSRVMAREGDAYVLEACVEGQAVEAWLT